MMLSSSSLLSHSHRELKGRAWSAAGVTLLRLCRERLAGRNPNTALQGGFVTSPASVYPSVPKGDPPSS